MLEFIKDPNARNLAGSVALFVVIYIAREIALRSLQKANFSNKDIKRRWIVQTRNVAILLLMIGLLSIWSNELKAFAISIVAFAVALVVGTKELITCFLGGMVKATNKLFTVGDRIEVNGIRGDVISHNFLITTLHEVGPGKEFHQFTGRVIIIPNSLYLSQAVINETDTGQYVLHTFKVSLDSSVKVKDEIQRLFDACIAECSSYLEDAKKQFKKLSYKEGYDTPNLEPRIQITMTDPKKIDLMVRVPAPFRRKGRVEQAILMRYLDIQEEKE